MKVAPVLADIRLMSRVGALVLDQAAALPKGRPTFIADIWLLSRMDALVLYQAATMSKA